MGAQQSSRGPPSIASQIVMPQTGYRIVNLQQDINLNEHKLNIMTDYVVGQDPRLLDLKQLYDNNQTKVQFNVFSILDYRTRIVSLDIKKHQFEPSQNQQQVLNEQCYHNALQQEKPQMGNNWYSKRQYTLGVSFKYYPKINDTILRISKIFKNSPLQIAEIKKDQYIVGVVQSDFTSMKSFVDLVKNMIQSKFQYVTLAICDCDGHTRLEKIAIKELQNWKKNYGVGYLGIQLAQGWLNKWELKKHIESKKKSQLSIIKDSNKTVSNQTSSKKPSDIKNLKQESQFSIIQTQLTKGQIELQSKKEEVDFFKHAPKISHQQEIPIIQNSQKNEQKNESDQKQNKFETQKSGTSDLKQLVRQDPLKNLENTNKNQQMFQQYNQQEESQENSEISSEQIETKCNQLEHHVYESNKKSLDIVKKSKNIIEINFKDDASTICLCKQYSKHCEKCFKEKQGNYYFFNKKTNRIILIEKAMLFPKKN